MAVSQKGRFGDVKSYRGDAVIFVPKGNGRNVPQQGEAAVPMAARWLLAEDDSEFRDFRVAFTLEGEAAQHLGCWAGQPLAP